METTTVLDAQTLDLLSSLDSFYVQQRVRWGEALTQGCWEQQNYYDVFDKTTGRRILIIKETSEAWSRICCAPGHSVIVRFYAVGPDAPQHSPGEKIDWSYEPSAPAVMTMERGGCDCCCGECPKPCLCWFACKDSCVEESRLYAGDLGAEAKPGENFVAAPRSNVALLGGAIQPIGGGGFTPTMQIMDRGQGGEAEKEEFAVAKGPCCFGGCSELCCDSVFGLSTPGASKDVLGDYATITKKKPASFSQAIRESLTDSDIYLVEFVAKQITPEQKANVLSSMIHLDYMFFERDNDMCKYENDGLSIVLFNCFCYGCVCPCKIHLSNNNSGGS